MLSLALTILAALHAVQAASQTHYCNSTQSCPEEYPCCSRDGVCGTGNYCLGGCNSKFSFNLTACVPQPVCRTGNYTFSKSSLVETQDFLGDTDENLWTYDGTVKNENNSLILEMPQEKTGAVVSSTFFVWYGKVTTRFKSSHNAGVISASILFSNIQDEIDVEIIGNSLEKPQSNFYYQGVLNYTNMENMSSTDAYESYHDYEVDWQEDYITWSIDGTPYRVLNKIDTYNETTDEYQYPQTPSRIQMSIWAGGDASNEIGIIEWAGGEIDWNASDFTDPGYLFAAVEWVDVQCYDPPEGTLIEGNMSYVYTDPDNFTQSTVMLTDNDTVLDNLGETGFNIYYDEEYGDDDDDDRHNSTESYNETHSISVSGSATQSTYHQIHTSVSPRLSTEFIQDIHTLSSSNGGVRMDAGSVLSGLFLLVSFVIV